MSIVNPNGRDIRPQSPASISSARRQPGNDWAPNLGAIPDNAPYDLPPPAASFTQHSNRSVPSLPSERLNVNPELAPNQPYDPTASLDSFNALHITEPVGRTSSAGSYGDPVQRSASSMSSRIPRHANTMPSSYLHSPDPSFMTANDAASVHSAGGSSYAGYEADAGASLYSADGSYAAASEPAPPVDYNNGYYTQQGDYTQHQGGQGYSQYPPQNNGPYQNQASFSSNQSAPYVSTSQGGYGQQDYGYAQSDYSSYNSPTSYDGPEFEGRPSMNRLGTAASVTPSSAKSKAVDLNAPPYTKEYIDQYRQRIKADPDPEAHFLYAKYLIDAARKIRATAKDQRSAKKYSEVLVGEALKVVRRLATQGQAYDEAQFFLANCYGTGALGLQVDHERAYHLYLQAAKQNHAASAYRVAVCNEIGAGTRKEPPRAAAFYRKAASLGDTAAMYKLGMILLNGHLGEAPNPREAINWLKRAAEQADQDNPHALYELALLHQNPQGTLVQYDPAYAKHLFTQAAQLGYIPAQFRLGQCFEFGALGCPVDPKRSIACGWYLTGSEGILKQSDSEAYLWARRAANKGLSKAEYAVGYYAEVGIGINQDIDFAKRWYMRAAAQGNKRAMNRLTEMKRQGNKRVNVARPTRQQAKDECVIF
ncbi:hypothetical protein DL96DRAFT_1708835 [Flagelloscypha sp. PMI_526]|nr:hypothetical protein DL96DRAFT_1708835 [Flagelloscypha sp. PMI_526]